MFQQTFCSSEVGAFKSIAFVHLSHKAYLLVSHCQSPPQVWIISPGPLYQKLSCHPAFLKPAGPLCHTPRMSGHWANCPEVRNHSCLPGEGHKCRIPLGSPHVWPGARSLPAPLPLQSRPGLTRPPVSRAYLEESFPTKGGKGDILQACWRFPAGMFWGQSHGCECRALLLRSFLLLLLPDYMKSGPGESYVRLPVSPGDAQLHGALCKWKSACFLGILCP